MLRAAQFSSSHDLSFGGYAIDFGWWPQSPSDYQEWYGGALSIAMRLALSDNPHREAARRLIAENFRAGALATWLISWRKLHSTSQVKNTGRKVG